MLECLIDNVFVIFGGLVFQQTIDIPMGTNCAPLLADLFIYSYEADFIQGLLKISELWCSGRVRSSCSTSGTRCVNLVTNQVINHEWGKDREVFTTSEAYCWSFVTYICSISVNQVMVAAVKLSKWWLQPIQGESLVQ